MRVRVLIGALVLALVYVVPGMANGIRRSSAATPLFPTDCQHLARRPPAILIACGDGNNRMERIRWKHWGSNRASGVGVDYANDCKPYCAAGHFHRFQARITLERPRYCAAHRVRQFTRLVLYFPRGTPVSGRSMRVSFPCPTHG